MKKCFIYLLALVALASCSQSENLYVPDSPNQKSGNSIITPEEAQESFLEFLEEFDKINGKQSRDETKRKVANVEVIPGSLFESRSLSSASDTSFYIVNLADSAGFGIISPSAQKRFDSHIIAFVENDNLSVEDIINEDNPGFQLYLMYAHYQLEYAPNDGPVVGGNPLPVDTVIEGWYINEYYKPMLKTKWGQGDVTEADSYGKYCPNKVAGCGPVAVAQIISHFKTIERVSWDYEGKFYFSPINWNRIMSDCELHDGKLSSTSTPSSMNQVAHLCRYISYGIDDVRFCFEADSTKNHTQTNAGDIVNWCKKRSGIATSDLKKYDEDEVISAIKNGKPVLISGKAKKDYLLGIIPAGYSKGHMWVCDGYINGFKNGRREHLLHCNWGWEGKRDGYFASKVLNANLEPLIPDPGSEDNNEHSNYQYNIQFASFSKKTINL